jgi:hypothetical protein
MSMRVARYRLRNPSRREEVYGDQIVDERSAFARARKLADFYRVPIEVCQVFAGRVARRVGDPVNPGPFAPIR